MKSPIRMFKKIGLLIVAGILIGNVQAEPGAPVQEAAVVTGEARKTTLKTEHFDNDPGWEGYNNRIKPDQKVVDQDFGYSKTHYAGNEKGEIGGKIWRSITPAFYAAKIPHKTLNEKLSATGRFTFIDSQSNAGLWFGWFNADQETGMARPRNCLGLNLDFQGAGARLSIRLVNAKHNGCGMFITPYLPGKLRTAPLGRHIQYAWTITYDPLANSGNGRVEFMMKRLNSNPAQELVLKTLRQEWDAVAKTHYQQKLATGQYGQRDFDGKLCAFDLPPGFKQQVAPFDHFGLLGIMKEGSPAEVYFDDLVYDGQREDFSRDPGWDGFHNRSRVQDALRTGYHDFGFSAATHFAGGAPGEVGGLFWRLSQFYAYYADRIGVLSLDDPLEAHGKLLLKLGTPDCEMSFGWFNSAQKEPNQLHLRRNDLGQLRRDPKETHLSKADNFLGIYLTKTRRGCALLPALVTARGTKIIHKQEGTPYLDPDVLYEWSMHYDPAAESGNGALSVTLGGQTTKMVLDGKLRAEGTAFDRFGFFPSGGAGLVQIYFDDLSYTSRRQ